MENKGCVLAVDDQPINVKLLSVQLQSAGFVVLMAYGGQEALDMAVKHMPDLILLDIMMPDMDGYEVCRRLKANALTAGIPVIFISALTDVAEKVNAFKCGGVDYICKPFQKEEVISRVGTHLNLYFLQRSLKEKVEEETAKRRGGEQILVQQSKMAAMGEMLGMIAHQWKQPLNAISATAQDLEDAFTHNQLDKEYLHSSVTTIISQTDFMLRTADDFRNFLRPSKEKIRFNVRDAVEEVISMFSPYFAKSGIALKLWLKGDDFTVTGYPNEFKQVVLNLISNSKDAILSRKDKGTENKIDITVRKDDRITITIRDTGGGIPEGMIDKIFKPYFTTKAPDKGTGIGLYMSKTIIETNMGWQLSVSNVEGGAEFRIDT
ncbi:hybrid sensor histidine kinase/response regulator [Candidatus Magnetominusculus dajiuhuensis]|uniref:hybrid sensor histidine kinase/response regulator n=1 Tax=Candidatus Magnetominusculus dajiuhuensis TaxID=3137712 RepID=UPI003B4339D4